MGKNEKIFRWKRKDKKGKKKKGLGVIKGERAWREHNSQSRVFSYPF